VPFTGSLLYLARAPDAGHLYQGHSAHLQIILSPEAGDRPAKGYPP